MGDGTKIEWSQATWNPTTGCDRVSPGCDHCYALTLAGRLKAMGQPKYQTDGDPRTSGPGFGVAVHPDTLDQPLRWRKPRRVFVNSMSDLFHKGVSDEFIARVFAVMAATPEHSYQVLTKRPGRMRSLVSSEAFAERVEDVAGAYTHGYDGTWPLPNVWLGVSVEDQHWADVRIPKLLETPAAVRFLSCEPLLGPLDLYEALRSELPTDLRRDWQVAVDWVIVGGESGPGARPMHPDWARSLRDQCTAAGVPFFFKQNGEWAPIGPVYDQVEEDEEADDARMDAAHLEVVEGRRVIELERDGTIVRGYQPGDLRTWLMARLGKKAAGRELDGRAWDEYPKGDQP